MSVIKNIDIMIGIIQYYLLFKLLNYIYINILIIIDLNIFSIILYINYIIPKL